MDDIKDDEVEMKGKVADNIDCKNECFLWELRRVCFCNEMRCAKSEFERLERMMRILGKFHSTS